jgi:hypothetical protein
MGSINIDNTGTGADVTLSSDGADLLLDGTAIGGGGSALELYAENPSSPTAPSATGTNAVAIGDGSTATQRNSFSMGGLADATAVESVAIGYSSTTSGSGNSVAIGMNANTSGWYASSFGFSAQATGGEALALGKSRASGTSSLAAAIANNSSSYGATGANSVAIGFGTTGSKSTSMRSLSFMGGVSSSFDAVAIGRGSTASGGLSFAQGYGSSATATYSLAFGTYAKSDIQGKFAFASNGSFSDSLSATGEAQQGTFVLRSDTTDATAEALTTNNSTASTDNQIILPNNSAYAFHGTIVARQKAGDGTASAAWKVEGLIRREGSAGTTTLVNSATTVLDNTPSWGMALSADTTNGGLKIEVTGAASTNIRWVATIHTSEVTYA